MPQHEGGAMASGSVETPQARIWQGEFGRDYTDRNTFDREQLDRLWSENYGISRSSINREFLELIPKDSSFLEVGCNVGNQLVLLRHLGYSNLSGLEIQDYALLVARSRLENVPLRQGSALALPFKDNSFDVVFTSGVLIHIAPEDLLRAMSEIHRCARNYVWGAEYFSAEPATVNYRGHDRLLWKMNYAQEYLSRFPDLELVREQRLPYLANHNVDTMFFLRKRPQ
jgi:pseudaminic acid biosynthesis-associated methylase